jgi:hypothetical protein
MIVRQRTNIDHISGITPALLLNHKSTIMTNTSFAILTEELEEWKQTLQFYLNETMQFQDRLTTIIRKKHKSEWSRQAEHYLEQFTDQIHLLLHLQSLIKERKLEGAQCKISLDDTEARHALRESMLISGKAFLELKYDYQNFLAQIANAESAQITT